MIEEVKGLIKAIEALAEKCTPIESNRPDIVKLDGYLVPRHEMNDVICKMGELREGKFVEFSWEEIAWDLWKAKPRCGVDPHILKFMQNYEKERAARPQH